MADIAGQQPALTDRLSRLFRGIPVAEHHIATADTDLSVHAISQFVPLIILHRHLHARDRHTNGAGLGVPRRIDRHHRAGLAEPIPLDQRHPRMARIESMEDFHGQRSGTADAQAQRRELDPRRNLRQRPE